MRWAHALIGSAVTVVALSGCGAAVSAINAASSPSSAPCTTKACIAADAKKILVGTTAKDEAVITALSCRQPTVKHAAPAVWTVQCTADYSDGMKAQGIASVLTSQGKVTWEPTKILDYGSGG